jgi:hypothetical protein
MLRLVEIALFLAPFVVVAIWRLLLPARSPSPRIVAVAVALVVVLIGSLLWLRREDAEAPADAYIPSHIKDGRIIPSSEAPR